MILDIGQLSKAAESTGKASVTVTQPLIVPEPDWLLVPKCQCRELGPVAQALHTTNQSDINSGS
jgi:hypothetical protein